MDTKLRKQSEKLLFINWKLREQLHQAKKHIEKLECEAKQFYTVAVYLKYKNVVIAALSKTYNTYTETKPITDFLFFSLGFTNYEYRVFISDSAGKCLLDVESEGFTAKEGERNEK